MIGGHHAGLADWGTADGSEAALSAQLEGRRKLLDDAMGAKTLPKDLLSANPPSWVFPVRTEESLHVFVRMLYSCLVDADSIDTERLGDPDKTTHRDIWPTLGHIEGRLNRAVASLPRDGAVMRFVGRFATK